MPVSAGTAQAKVSVSGVGVDVIPAGHSLAFAGHRVGLRGALAMSAATTETSVEKADIEPFVL